MTIQYILKFASVTLKKQLSKVQWGNLGHRSGCLQKLWTDGFCRAPFWKWSVSHRTSNEKGCAALCSGLTQRAHPPSTPQRLPPPSTQAHTLTKATEHLHRLCRSSNLWQWLFHFSNNLLSAQPFPLYSALYTAVAFVSRGEVNSKAQDQALFLLFPKWGRGSRWLRASVWRPRDQHG